MTSSVMLPLVVRKYASVFLIQHIRNAWSRSCRSDLQRTTDEGAAVASASPYSLLDRPAAAIQFGIRFSRKAAIPSAFSDPLIRPRKTFRSVSR